MTGAGTAFGLTDGNVSGFTAFRPGFIVAVCFMATGVGLIEGVVDATAVDFFTSVVTVVDEGPVNKPRSGRVVVNACRNGRPVA